MAGCASTVPSPTDTRTRLAVTTVSFRERYAVRLGNAWTPATDHFLNAPRFVKENLGLTSLEVWNLQFEEDTNDYCLRLREAADRAGVKLVNIQLDSGYDLSSADADARRSSIAFVQRWIDRAALLGASSVRANLDGTQAVGVFPLERVVDSFRQLTAYGRSKGVKILVENHVGHSVNIQNPVSVLKSVNDPWCRAIADWGNTPAPSLSDRIAQLALLSPWLDLVSAKVANFDADYKVTDYDIAALTEATERSGFSGLYSVELFNMANPPADTVRAARSVVGTIERAIRG
jgi:sugar phosphate isomerase/epimerase